MSRYLLTINSAARREQAHRLIDAAPSGSRVEIKAAKRSLPQNDRMWAMLTDVATQLPWHGVKLRPDDWKLIFLDALKRELRMVPNIDETGFVNLGRSSSDLTKSEMSDLIELIFKFGAEHGVTFQEDAEETTISPSSRPLAPNPAEPRPATGQPSSPVAGSYSKRENIPA